MARNAGRDLPDFTASLVALPTFGDLFICAKDLFVEANDDRRYRKNHPEDICEPIWPPGEDTMAPKPGL